MAVLKNNRHECELDAIVKARDVATYTAQILNNEKAFPKRGRWIIAADISKHALAAFTCTRCANDIRVETPIDYNYRRLEQQKAHANLEALLSLIEIAKGLYSIETKRIEYWTGLIIKAEALIDKWRLSDEKRYLNK